MKYLSRLLITVIAAVLVSSSVQAADPVVRLVMFWSKTCPHCHEVLENTLPPLQEEYGDTLEVLSLELSDPNNYQVWLAALHMFQVPPNMQGVPMVIIGDNVLVGSYDIPQKLPELIKGYRVAGGLDYPPIPGLLERPAATLPPATPTPRPTPTLKACHLCDDEPTPETASPDEPSASSSPMSCKCCIVCFSRVGFSG